MPMASFEFQFRYSDSNQLFSTPLIIIVVARKAHCPSVHRPVNKVIENVFITKRFLQINLFFSE